MGVAPGRVTDPDRGGEVGREAGEPSRAVALGGAGLAGGRSVELRRSAGAAGVGAVDHAPQHRGHPVGDVRIQHLLARRIEGSDRLAGAVGDGADTPRRAEATVRRQPGVRPGHGQRADLVRPEGERGHPGQRLTVRAADAERLGERGRTVQAGPLLELDVVGVHRLPGGLHQVESPGFTVAGIGHGVRRLPTALEVAELGGCVPLRRVDGGGQRQALLQGGRQHEHLERRPGLEAAATAGGQVHLGLVRGAVVTVVSVDRHRLDGPGARPHDVDRRGERAVPRYGGVDRILRRRLDRGHQRRGDGQPAAVEPGGALLRRGTELRVIEQAGLDEVAEEGHRAGLAALWRRGGLQRQRGGDRRLGLGRGDVAEPGHPVQDNVTPRQRPVRMLQGVVERRTLDQPGQHRGLGQVELLDTNAEVVPGRGRDAVGAVAEVGDVQVPRQDLVLAQLAVQRQGVAQLAQLAAQGRRSGLGLRLLRIRRLHQHVLDVLLGQGGASLAGAADAKVGRQGADGPPDVEAMMVVEPGVFDVDQGLPGDQRDVG